MLSCKAEPRSGNPIRRIFPFYRSCLTNSRNYAYWSNVQYSTTKFFLAYCLLRLAPLLNLSHPIVPLASTGGYSLHPSGWSTEAQCRTWLTRCGCILGRAHFQLATLGNRRSWQVVLKGFSQSPLTGWRFSIVGVSKWGLLLLLLWGWEEVRGFLLRASKMRLASLFTLAAFLNWTPSAQPLCR